MPATYDNIATTTVSGSSTTQIVFNSLPTTYTDLKIVMVARSDVRTLWLQFNGDTGTNYSSTRLTGSGSAAASGRSTSDNNITIGAIFDMSTTIPFLYNIDVFSYRSATNKTILSSTSADQNGSGGIELDVGLWRNTSAITSITLQCGNGASSFVAGTTATLYGIKNA